VLIRDNVGWRLDRSAVYREQNVSRSDTGKVCGRLRRDIDRGDAFRAGSPEHSVFDLVPLRADGDVGDAEGEQRDDDEDREDRTCLRMPAGIVRVMPAGNRQSSRLTVTRGQLQIRHGRRQKRQGSADR